MTSSWITTIKRTAATVFTAAAVLVSGCSSPETSDTTSLNSYKYEQELNIIDDNFRNYYQIFVGSFCDSSGDGIGVSLQSWIISRTWASTESGSRR